MTGNGTVVLDVRNIEGELTGYIAGLSDSDGVWAPVGAPDAPVIALKEFMIGLVQQYRQGAEDTGVDVKGNVFSTDISSQVKYVGILVYAAFNRDYVGTWKTVNSGFVTLDAEGVSIMCACVMAYVQVCFAWEQYMFGQISAATTVEQLQAIDLETGRPAGQLPGYISAALEAAGGAFGSGVTQGNKFKGTSMPPTIAAGAGAGDTASVSLSSNSSDSAGQISVVASGTIVGDTGAVIAEVAFDVPYATTPFVVISAANVAAGNLVNMPYVTASTTGFSLRVSNNAGLTPAMHLFNYVAIQ